MLVHVESRSLLLRAQNIQKITAVIPKHRLIDYEGHNIAVRHGLDEFKILRNMGIKAPPPIYYYYDWPHPPGKAPLKHQKHTAAFFTAHNRCFCFNEPGTAKTACALWAADYLMNVGAIRRVLVVAPNSSLEVTWMEEIFQFLMHRKAALLVGSKKRRLDLLATNSDFYVINHEGVATIADDLKGRLDIDLVIGDECDVYRNGGTDLYNTFAEVIKRRRAWLMSGTPCPNAPTDAWALTRLLDKTRVSEYFSRFKKQTMFQVSQYKWVPRANSYEAAFNAMQPAIRYLKKDCFDLPPLTVTRRQAAITDEQKKALIALRQEAVMQAKNGVKITAVNAADKINKMRQVLLGAVKDPTTDTYIEVDHKTRLNLLLTEIAHAPSKVLVIVPFKGIIRVLQKELEKHYTFEVINGDVTRNERTEIIKRFKNTADPHGLLCHPKVMSHSLNLAEAATIIFYGPIYSNAQFGQVIERIARPGQKLPMGQVRIAAHPIEWDIYNEIDRQQDDQTSILKLYQKHLIDA